MLLGQELKFKNKLCNLKLGTFFSALPGLGASALSGRAASRNFGFSGVEVLYSQKKLDISFQVTKFQMIFWERSKALKA